MEEENINIKSEEIEHQQIEPQEEVHEQQEIHENENEQIPNPNPQSPLNQN